MSVYNIVNKLKPLEVFDIITMGHCDNHRSEISKQIIELKGQWYLDNWGKGLDLLKIYLSESGFQLYTTKEEADNLYKEFKSWDIFYDVWVRWYSCSTYIVGFQYDEKAFSILYNQWLRDKKLESLV